MTLDRAIRLAQKWADGMVCTLQDGEAQEYHKLALSALRAQQEKPEGKPLETTWETPETCPHCMEHLSLDWSYCPECGCPTDWSKNEPLTLEELQKMVGNPVWLHTYSPVQRKTNIACWAIVEAASEANVTFVRAGCNSRLIKWFANYSERWLAYRHKPKEETQ